MSEKKIGSEVELRRRALKELQNNNKAVPAPESFGELQRSVHELQVHQIELEMQNEELQLIRSQLESLLVEFVDLYDFAPIGYVTLSMSGLIQQINLTGARMLGLDRSRIVNQNFIQFIAADSRSAFTAYLARIFNNDFPKHAVIELQKEGSDPIFVHVEGRVVKDGYECRTVLMDITVQKQAEDMLRDSEERYRTLFENMIRGVVIYGSDGVILSANPAAERILELKIEQMWERSVTNFHESAKHEDGTDFPGDTHPSVVALRTGKKELDVIMAFKSQRTGRYIWLKISAIPQFKAGANRPYQVFTMFEDITIHKRMESYNRLTEREKEVFKLLTKGLGRKIVADFLDIRPKTVDKHRANLMEKLNLYEKEELTVFAKMIGIL